MRPAPCSMLFSHEIENAGFGSQLGFTPESILGTQNFPHLRVRLVEVAKDQGPMGRLYAGRLKPLRQSLFTKIAFLHHPFSARREIRIDLFDKRPGIMPIEASGSEGAGRHAESAADAAMHVHHDDSVLSPKSGPGRTHPDTRRVIAMIA